MNRDGTNKGSFNAMGSGLQDESENQQLESAKIQNEYDKIRAHIDNNESRDHPLGKIGSQNSSQVMSTPVEKFPRSTSSNYNMDQ